MTETMVQFSAQGGAGQGQPAPAVELPNNGNAPENSPVPAQQAANQSTGLTEEQIRKIIQEETIRALETANRRTQSQIAKAENRIKGLVNSQLDLLKQANVQVTPEQAQAIEQTIRAKVSNQPETTPLQDAQPGEEGMSEEEEPDPVTLAGFALMESLGVQLTNADPEAAQLDMSSPKAYLTSLHKALLSKKARLETSPQARTPAGGGAPSNTPVHAGLSGTETLALAFKNIFGE